MRCHIGSISFGSVVELLMSYLQMILFANTIFAWHDSAVVDIPKYGQCNRP